MKHEVEITVKRGQIPNWFMWLGYIFFVIPFWIYVIYLWVTGGIP